MLKKNQLVEYIDANTPKYGFWDGTKVQLFDHDKTIVRNPKWLIAVNIFDIKYMCTSPTTEIEFNFLRIYLMQLIAHHKPTNLDYRMKTFAEQGYIEYGHNSGEFIPFKLWKKKIQSNNNK